mmetsp:Transcript_6257/g.19715  ORF Transcript_6257/g.19715 Transcript_6257/m.19715 type:complete len:555 (-) Transcript_6257:26-1690(-)
MLAADDPRGGRRRAGAGADSGAGAGTSGGEGDRRVRLRRLRRGRRARFVRRRLCEVRVRGIAHVRRGRGGAQTARAREEEGREGGGRGGGGEGAVSKAAQGHVPDDGRGAQADGRAPRDRRGARRDRQRPETARLPQGVPQHGARPAALVPQAQVPPGQARRREEALAAARVHRADRHREDPARRRGGQRAEEGRREAARPRRAQDGPHGRGLPGAPRRVLQVADEAAPVDPRRAVFRGQGVRGPPEGEAARHALRVVKSRVGHARRRAAAVAHQHAALRPAAVVPEPADRRAERAHPRRRVVRLPPRRLGQAARRRVRPTVVRRRLRRRARRRAAGAVDETGRHGRLLGRARGRRRRRRRLPRRRGLRGRRRRRVQPDQPAAAARVAGGLVVRRSVGDVGHRDAAGHRGPVVRRVGPRDAGRDRPPEARGPRDAGLVVGRVRHQSALPGARRGEGARARRRRDALRVRKAVQGRGRGRRGVAGPVAARRRPRGPGRAARQVRARRGRRRRRRHRRRPRGGLARAEAPHRLGPRQSREEAQGRGQLQVLSAAGL